MMKALVKGIVAVATLLLSGCYVHPSHVHYSSNQQIPRYDRVYYNHGSRNYRSNNNYRYSEERNRGMNEHHHDERRVNQSHSRSRSSSGHQHKH